MHLREEMNYRVKVKVVMLSMDQGRNSMTTVDRKDLDFTVKVSEPSGVKQLATEAFDKRYGPDMHVRTVSMQGRENALLYCLPAHQQARATATRDIGNFLKALPRQPR